MTAIESVMGEIRKHLKRANIDQPVIDAAALAKTIPSKAKKGVGERKREEVRFLIASQSRAKKWSGAQGNRAAPAR